MSVIVIGTDKLNALASAEFRKSKKITVGDKDNPNVRWEGKSKLAIITGKHGVIVTDGECIHNVFKNDEESVTLDFYRYEKTGKDTSSFGIFPAFNMSLTVKELLTLDSKKKMKWEEFVHVFGSTKDRMISNYALLQRSFREIGATDKLPKWERPSENSRTMKALHQARA
jgi:hypothetical protein